jgi:hypothetical protein
MQGAKAKQLEIAKLMDADEDICDSVGSCSEDDDNIYTDEGLQGHITYVQESWIPRISAEVQTSMIGRLQEDNGQQIAATVDKTVVRTEHLLRLLNTYEVTKEIVDAYGRRLQTSYTRRLCKFLPTSFFDKLFNPNGRRQQDKGILNISACKGYTAEINIFEYQILLIPIFANRHWSLIAADMQTRQVRYIDSEGEGGLSYILAIRRWMASEWKRFYKSAFPTWRTILSDSTHTPQQGKSNACGIFTIMRMQLLADGQDVQRFNEEHLMEASYYIAYRIIQPVQDGQMLARPVYPKKKESGQIKLIPTGLCCSEENEETEDTNPAIDEKEISQMDTPSLPIAESEVPIIQREIKEMKSTAPGPRRSNRVNKFMGKLAERQGLPWNHNAHRLQIQTIQDLGWCLFAKDHFKANEPIAVNSGKKLKAEIARSDKHRSDYVVELGELFIDAWDAKRKLCKAYAGYSNEAINKQGRRDC